ncbi:unnamed protein product [Calypogeia fissa]
MGTSSWALGVGVRWRVSSGKLLGRHSTVFLEIFGGSCRGRMHSGKHLERHSVSMLRGMGGVLEAADRDDGANDIGANLNDGAIGDLGDKRLGK